MPSIPGLSRASAAKLVEAIAAPAGGPLVSVSDRMRPAFNTTGNSPNAPQSNGTNLGGTGREKAIIQITSHGFVADLSSWWCSAGLEAAATNDVTIRVVLEIGTGQAIPFMFSGQPTVNMSALAPKLRSDPLGVTLAKGAAVWVRIYISGLSAGQKYQLLRASRSNPQGEGINVDPAVAGPGTDVTGWAVAWNPHANGTLGVRIPGLSALLATPAKPSGVLLGLGDSILSGTGEHQCYGTTNGSSEFLDFGWVNRACNNKWPRLLIGISGTTIAAWNDPTLSFRRRAFVESIHFTHIVNELIINDINQASIPVTTIQARLIALWMNLAVYRKPIYQCTAAPFTVSTDEWSSLAGQSTGLPSGQEAVRVAANNWLRDGSPITKATMVAAATGAVGAGIIRAGQTGHPLAAGDQFGKGYIEVADAVESARDSGLWKIPTFVRKVTDAAITSGTTTLSSASAAFTTADVGLYVRVTGAGAAGGTMFGYITAVTGGNATLHVAASTTVSGAAAVVGARSLCADGIHHSGDYGTNKGGHAVTADYVRPQLVTILGADAT